MSFPDNRYVTAGAFCSDYLAELSRAARSIDPAAMEAAADLLRDAFDRDATLFSCGNGGSAAISDHLVCDCAKGTRTDTGWTPRVISLSATTSLITAIANDIAYGEIFAYQIDSFGRPGDVLLTISSSGNSPNVIRAIEAARARGMRSISLTGFDGGGSAKLADVNIHVDAGNYGVIEDAHQSIMHILAQYLRQSRMPDDLIALRTF
jgi:phosphoheptose isomerase